MIQGYRAPASTAEITGTPTGLVLATSRTLTTTAALPADLSGAVVRIVAGKGAGTVRTIASVSGGTITLVDAEWGVELDATSVFVVVDLVGTTVAALPVAIADADTPGRPHHADRRLDAPGGGQRRSPTTSTPSS